MKKWLGYAVIILPIIVVAYKWQVWDSCVGAMMLALVALFNCLAWSEYCDECKKKKGTEQDQ